MTGVAGTAGTGAAVGDAGQGGEQAAAPGDNYTALTSALEGFSGWHEELRQQLQGIAGGQVAFGDGAAQPDTGPGEPGSVFDVPDHFSDAELAQHLQQFGQQAADVEQQVAQAVAPIERQLADDRQERAARSLVEENSNWADPAYAGPMLKLASSYAHDHFGEAARVISNNPAWWRIVGLAHAGVEAANAQLGAEAPSTARLEGGGGAAPSGQQVDLGDQIVSAGGGGRSALPFP